MKLTTEQIKQILYGAPVNDWTHYCTRNRQYFKRDGNTNRLFVWLSHTEVWSVPPVGKPRWLERREQLEEILALRQRVMELERDNKSLTFKVGLIKHKVDIDARKEVLLSVIGRPTTSILAERDAEVARKAFIAGYAAGNGYPPSDWEVKQYLESVKE